MSGVGDFIGAFRSGLRPGPSEPGTWRDMERFGRFRGSGEVVAELDLPSVSLAVSAEDHRQVEELEFELTGPAGDPVEVKRYSSRNFDSEGLKNLHRIATTKITEPGLHHLRVKAPDPEQPLLIVVGEELTPTKALKDMGRDMVPGAKLWRRLRGDA